LGDGQYNVVVGYNAALRMVANNNVIVGALAMQNIPENYVIVQNVVVGDSAGFSIGGNTTSSVVVGANAAQNLVGTAGTIAIGFEALKVSTTGINTAVGYRAGDAITTGSLNTLMGYNAGTAITTGVRNNLIGDSAGVAMTTGQQNVCIGYTAGNLVTTGSLNTYIGEGVVGNATGNNNTIIGSSNTNFATNNNIMLGSSSSMGGFSGCIMFGVGDTATANKEIRFGSLANDVGSIVVGAVAVGKRWNVFINGVAQQILLA
jgi:hypothetical protein